MEEGGGLPQLLIGADYEPTRWVHIGGQASPAPLSLTMEPELFNRSPERTIPRRSTLPHLPSPPSDLPAQSELRPDESKLRSPPPHSAEAQPSPPDAAGPSPGLPLGALSPPLLGDSDRRSTTPVWPLDSWDSALKDTSPDPFVCSPASDVPELHDDSGLGQGTHFQNGDFLDFAHLAHLDDQPDAQESDTTLSSVPHHAAQCDNNALSYTSTMDPPRRLSESELGLPAPDELGWAAELGGLEPATLSAADREDSAAFDELVGLKARLPDAALPKHQQWTAAKTLARSRSHSQGPSCEAPKKRAKLRQCLSEGDSSASAAAPAPPTPSRPARPSRTRQTPAFQLSSQQLPPPQPSKTAASSSSPRLSLKPPAPQPPSETPKRKRCRPSRPKSPPPLPPNPNCDVVVWLDKLTSLESPPVRASLHSPEWPANPLAGRDARLADKRVCHWIPGLRHSVTRHTVLGKEAVSEQQAEGRKRHFLDAGSQFVVRALLRDLPSMSQRDRDAFFSIPLFRKVAAWWWPSEVAAGEASSAPPHSRPSFGGLLAAAPCHRRFCEQRRKNLSERAAHDSYSEWSETDGKKALGLRKTTCVHLLQAILHLHLPTAEPMQQEALLYHLYDFWATMLPPGSLRLKLPKAGLNYRRFGPHAQ